MRQALVVHTWFLLLLLQSPFGSSPFRPKGHRKFPPSATSNNLWGGTAKMGWAATATNGVKSEAARSKIFPFGVFSFFRVSLFKEFAVSFPRRSCAKSGVTATWDSSKITPPAQFWSGGLWVWKPVYGYELVLFWKKRSPKQTQGTHPHVKSMSVSSRVVSDSKVL